MAVKTKPTLTFPCVTSGNRFGSSRHGRTLKWMWNIIKTQICTIGLSLTLFTTVRLPQESSKYGAVPYLVVYSFWLVIVGLPTVLMQLAMGQLSHQDPVGVWRAVPILRGVGHLKILTAYLCCVYYMVVIALSAAYLLWIAKGNIPLKDCTRLQITPNGYENKMNGTECFNSTFLSPFMEHPQYLGVMAILMFVLWFFIPILLYRLRKSLKVSLNIITLIIVIIAIIICTFISDLNALNEILKSCEQWMSILEPYVWQSALAQVIISTQIMSGYLTSSGGSIYRHSDVRWTATFIIITNLLSSWIWVFLWESISINGLKDRSFVAILVLIYETSMIKRRLKIWPLLLYAMIILSGINTILVLLFPIFDKLQRISRENWRLFAIALSAIGTALSIAVLVRGLMVATLLDEMVLPILAAFTTAVEVVGFTCIYGWQHILADIDFLTKSRLPCLWVSGWWTTPIILVAITGWWLRSVLQLTTEWMDRVHSLWPLIGEFIGILVIMIVTAAVAVAKEEQFNLFSKISSAFKPSRLWGPKEPLARYVWMSQKFVNEDISSVLAEDIEQNLHYSTIIQSINDDKKKKDNNEYVENKRYQRKSKSSKSSRSEELSVPVDHKTHRNRSKKSIKETKFRSPNICLAKGQLGGPVNCSCNRHFTLNVPQLVRNDECSTSL